MMANWTNYCVANVIETVQKSVYILAALYSPETLFFCYWYSFLLEAEQTSVELGK
jgi:hypothetical protein